MNNVEQSSNKQALELGFIGGGIDSAVGYVHASSCQLDGNFKLVSACFSQDHRINQNSAERWGLSKERVYDSYAQLLTKEQGRLDALVVLTPTPSHSEIICKALDAGYAVISEKALTVSIDQAKDIQAALEKNKGFLTVTYNYSAYPMIRELRRIIQNAQLGKLLQIQIEMPQEGFIRRGPNGEAATPQKWRLEDYSIPTISLDLGTHIHHLISFLSAQKPIEVMADQRNMGNFSSLIDDVVCWVNYSNSLKAQIWYSKAALGHRNGLRLRVYGDQGSAEWEQIYPDHLTINRADGKRELLDSGAPCEIPKESRYSRFKPGHPAGFIEAFANLYHDIAISLREYKTSGSASFNYLAKFEDAYEGLVLLDALNRSSKLRSWQKVELA